MKLLIIAGPYEADRIRRAAVSAGFEAVAVEPGESLSGWITATRPDLIILAPRIVSPDLDTAMGKVRAVPRGRVPIFLVGDAEEQEDLQNQADGFFARPVALLDLFARAEEAVARAAPRLGEDAGSGPHEAPGSDPQARVAAADAVDDSARVQAFSKPEGTPTRTPTLRPLVAAREKSGAASASVVRDSTEASTRAGIPVPRKTSERWPPAMPLPVPGGAAGRRERVPGLPADLVEDIEADFDAEIREVVRVVGVLRQAKAAAASVPSGLEPAGHDQGLVELKDESSQKTLEVPSSVSAALIQTERPAKPSVSEREPRDARDLILSRHALVMDGDYFQILGISRDASAPDIQRAHERLLADLSPRALPAAIAVELERELGEIRTVLAEAARLLSDDGLRAQYRRHLPALSSQPPSPSSPSSSSDPVPADAASGGEGAVP